MTELGSTVPTAVSRHVGTLTDRDIKNSSQSRFYSTRLRFPPLFLRYEVEAKIEDEQERQRRARLSGEQSIEEINEMLDTLEREEK